ncbi:MAG: hypothetical protein NC299_14720 [Lachnospiraceae bacterium]|nr:hypothetical protein [Ruminococcus sp.]MCM1276590.1 hypothetical protein [Lachnospiraceae bacterium]
MKIEFVSFTGKYPRLCLGTLMLRIDGRETTFGCLKCLKDAADYENFWESGGRFVHLDGEDCVTHGNWRVVEERLPDFLKPHAAELAGIMNQNVPRGHCGGCVWEENG